MKPPDIPDNEPQRLATLQSLDILDTVPEERFDRLTRMAKRLFGVPVALVSLVDANRQWFKSCDGLDVSETPRDVSFCGHAILGDGVFLIPDATLDERFKDNPLVVNEPYVRFYAGCPLLAYNGCRLGTLCIIDHSPRQMDDEDLLVLKDLAAMVERELAALQLATVDELTNVANRRGFMHMAQHSLRLCARQKSQASLVVFDLDNFKQINDTFGHGEGDKALVTFVESTRAVLRDSDLFARVGGDEFVALLNDAPTQFAESVCLRARQQLQALNQHTQDGYTIEFSYGVVAYNPDLHNSVEDLVSEGDALMYRQKQLRHQ